MVVFPACPGGGEDPPPGPWPSKSSAWHVLGADLPFAQHVPSMVPLTRSRPIQMPHNDLNRGRLKR